jgi:hypothetical protein
VRSVVCFAEDTKAVVSALNRMRSANINPAEDQLQRAADVASNKGDAGLLAVLRQCAAEMLPPTHPLNRRLKVGYAQGRPRGDQGGALGARGGRDVWNSAADSSSSSGSAGSSSRGGGSSISGSAGGSRSGSSSSVSLASNSQADVWRPGQDDRGDSKWGDSKQVASGEDGASDGEGNGGNSRRLAGLKAAIGG